MFGCQLSVNSCSHNILSIPTYVVCVYIRIAFVWLYYNAQNIHNVIIQQNDRENHKIKKK